MKTRNVRYLIVPLLAALAAAPDVSANSAPVVSNVTVSQRTDGSKIVDIRYNLTDADGDACTVSVQASSDGGATWTVPITGVTGHVGSGITPGVNKYIVWTCATDLPGAFGTQYKIRVCADDAPTPIPPGMVVIPAGEFQMGNSLSGGAIYELPVHAVYVDAFFMDRYEVTNQQYAEALNWAKNQCNLFRVTIGVVHNYNGGMSYPYCTTTSAPTGHPIHGEQSRITWNGTTFGVTTGKENHPMTSVSWYGAVAYANWRSAMQGKPLCYDLSTWICNWGSGYRLPTEAEWEKAARGGAAGRRFPWSDTDTIQHARANYCSFGGPPPDLFPWDTSPTRGYHPAFSGGPMPYTSPAGYFAANGYGLYDMAGNVWEWCNDWYDGAYYSGSPYSNPHGPTSGSYRVLRGGCWYDEPGGADFCRCAYRSDAYTPSDRGQDCGFRLALDSE